MIFRLFTKIFVKLLRNNNHLGNLSMFKSTIALASLLLLSSTTFAAKDPVVAVVDGIKIKKSELDKTYHENLMFVSDKLVTKEKVLNDLINRQLGVKRAKKAKLDKDPIVKRKMEDIMYHAQISKDLEPRLKKIVVTEADVDGYYKNYPEYRTAHILFRVRTNPEEEENKAALNQALKVYNTLKKKPEAFAELANKFSQSSTAPNGGDMGFQPAIRLAPEYFNAVKGQKKDFITPPVKSQFGYHIIKVMGVKSVKSINNALYKKIVYDKKRDAILDTYFRELRAKAKVKISKQFLK
jgi:peptidyl-prolyl cis-trans isomerase C